MPSIIQITSATTHSTFTQKCESNGEPFIIYVSDPALPACKSFTPRYEKLASRFTNVTFAQMKLTSDTSMLFKFAPNQLPVLTLMCRQSEEDGGMPWAKTIMGGDLEALESGIEEMLAKAGFGK